MADISLQDLSKRFDANVPAVDGINLEIDDGELLVLVGPSGCGKSTLLRMIAGLEEVTTGSVVISGRDVTYLQPKDRDIAMVFQGYALYPHMSVGRNIAYPLKVAGVPKEERAKRVEEVARLLQLDQLLDRRPAKLSGGQRQRVAMGRALVRQPQAFLMDEPLSNLDAKLRVEMRAEIARLQRELEVTTIYVTHDQVEAMTMGTRVAVLDQGRIQQVDTPQRIYDEPANLFVATFMGSPAMNLLPGKLISRPSGDGYAIDLGTQTIGLGGAAERTFPGLPGQVGEDVVVGVRPEALADVAVEAGTSGDLVIEASVDLVESLGAELIVHVEVAGVKRATPGAAGGAEDGGDARQNGESDRLTYDGRAVARLSTRSRLAQGDVLKLAIDPAGLHLFHPVSGASLRA